MTPPPTLADLAAAPGELIASCQNCHHNTILPVALVLSRYGPTTPFSEVKGRLMSGRTGRGARPARSPAIPTDDG
jgi:hypothetical protein